LWQVCRVGRTGEVGNEGPQDIPPIDDSREDDRGSQSTFSVAADIP
jgi:hypothetical protein